MPAFQAFVARVKNTFIEISIPRRCESFSCNDRDEEPRRATFPRRLQSWNVKTPRSLGVASDRTSNVKDDDTDDLRPRVDSQATTAANSQQSYSPSHSFGEPELTLPFWAGKVWKMARQRQGCRHLQAALDAISTDDEKMALVSELRGHIQEAARCPQANYVLQKVIAVTKPSDLQFVVDEIMNKGIRGVNMVARHKYGCRVIQRLLEHCSANQGDVLAETLLAESGWLDTCLNAYGTYVMQHLYEHGNAAHRRRLASLLAQKCSLATDMNFCAVIGKILAIGESCDQVLLVQSLQRVPALFTAMDRHKAGQFTARLARQITTA